MRFPGFLKGHKERRQAKEQEREMAMRGWNKGMTDMPHMGAGFQRHMPFGMGHHSPRGAITRGRGQGNKHAWA